MTLDQYYYPTLTDTDSRDKDQVLSKYLEWKTLERKRQTTTSNISDRTDHNAKDHSISILKVDQIWIWIVDESMGPRLTPQYHQDDWLTNRQKQS